MPEAPVLPDAGWLPQAITPEEREASGVYYEWLAGVGRTYKVVTDRLTEIREACLRRLPKEPTD